MNVAGITWHAIAHYEEWIPALAGMTGDGAAGMTCGLTPEA